jgi:hypothetical protein
LTVQSQRFTTIQYPQRLLNPRSLRQNDLHQTNLRKFAFISLDGRFSHLPIFLSNSVGGIRKSPSNRRERSIPRLEEENKDPSLHIKRKPANSSSLIEGTTLVPTRSASSRPQAESYDTSTSRRKEPHQNVVIAALSYLE